MDKSATDPPRDLRALKASAKKAFRAFIRGHDIKLKEIPEGKGSLSVSTIDRRLGTNDEKKYDSVQDWANQLIPIFRRVSELVRDRSEPGEGPLTWEQLFGPDVPQPTGAKRDIPTFNRSRVNSSEIRNAAAPLIIVLQQLFESNESNGNVWKNGQILAHLCSILELTEKWADAAHFLGVLAKNNRKTNDFHFEADAHLRQGQAHFFNREIEKAENAIGAGLNVIRDFAYRTPPYRTQLRLLNYKAMILSEYGRHDEALEILEKECLPLAEEKCSNGALASVRNRIGMIMVRRGDNAQKAIAHLQEALEFRAEMGMFSEASRTLYLMGCAFGELMKDYPRALIVWEIASRIQTKYSDFDVLAQTQLGCGLAYLELSTARFPIRITTTLISDRKLQSRLEKVAGNVGFREIDITNAASCLDLAQSRLQGARVNAMDSTILGAADAALKKVEPGDGIISSRSTDIHT